MVARFPDSMQDLRQAAVDRIGDRGNIAAMPSTSLGYRTALRLGTALVPTLGTIFPPAGRAATRGAAGCRESGCWTGPVRAGTRARPLVWFHAASVGEGLQAESVLRQFRRLRPDCQVVYTHFSPSAESLAARLAVDVADYLPYDLPDNVDRLLSALKPDLLVFAKLGSLAGAVDPGGDDWHRRWPWSPQP